MYYSFVAIRIFPTMFAVLSAPAITTCRIFPPTSSEPAVDPVVGKASSPAASLVSATVAIAVAAPV